MKKPVTVLMLIYSITLTICSDGAMAKANDKLGQKDNTDKVVGCWKWTLPLRGKFQVTETHRFKPNKQYLGSREVIGAPYKTDLVYYPGECLRYGNYIIVKDKRRETMKFKLRSPEELEMVGTASIYSRC